MEGEELFEIAQDIIRFIRSTSTEVGIKPLVFLDAPKLNPRRRQMRCGLCLEYYYGMPAALWTTWGDLTFLASCIATFEKQNKLRDAIIKELAAVPYAIGGSDLGEIGPVYAIRRYGTIKLPYPAERQKCINTKSAWDKLLKLWNA